MPANTESDEYLKRKSHWGRIQVVLEGEEAIKDAGEDYLPRLGGQSDNQYAAYKDRGSFFGATARTLQGLVGAVMRKSPVVTAPPKIEEYLEDMTLTGLSFSEVVRLCVNDVIAYGYYGMLVDMPQGGIEGARPYVALYSAPDIINYRVEQIDGEYKLSLLCLKEKVPAEGEDEYSVAEEDQIRVLKLVPLEGEENKNKRFLTIKIYNLADSEKDLWGLTKTIVPSIQGSFIEVIPFVFFGAVANLPKPPKPPLLDLANLNIKHWQISVDYYHGLHWCAIPTPWVSGVGDLSEIHLGPEKALILEKEQAKAGMLEFTGQGMGAVEKGLDRIENQMAVVGARLLEERRRGVEAAEALKIRASDDAATLGTMVASVENGTTQALKFMALWTNIDDSGIETELNRDFVSERLSATDIEGLVKAFQVGTISKDTFIYNLMMGEILPKGRTVEEEKEMIAAEEAEEFEAEVAPGGEEELEEEGLELEKEE